MQAIKFDSKAASLAVAAAVAALNPVVHGYFNLTIEVGNDITVSVFAQNKPTLDIFSYRVWTCDEDGNEVDIPFAAIDTELIESSVIA